MRAGSAFHLLDVFTRRKFGGVRLAVVEGAEARPTELTSSLAREFGAATVFVVPPDDAVNSAKVVCVSAQGEALAFSPAALIGAATVLAQTRAPEVLAQRSVVVALEASGATYACDVIRGVSSVVYAQFALARAPLPRAAAPGAEDLARALGLSAADLRFGAHAPRVYEALAPYAYAPVRSREALYRARPLAGELPALLGDGCGLFLYAADPLEGDAAIHARLFAKDGAEAPACAEAVAGFAGVALEFEKPPDGAHELVVEQGHGAGRPARLTLRMDVDRGALVDVGLGGQVAPIASGALSS